MYYILARRWWWWPLRSWWPVAAAAAAARTCWGAPRSRGWRGKTTRWANIIQGRRIRVEWFSTFLQFSKTGTLLPIRYSFTSIFSSKIVKFVLSRAEHARQSFHSLKIAETLKRNIFIENLQISSFYFKRQVPKWAKENFGFEVLKQSACFFLLKNRSTLDACLDGFYKTTVGVIQNFKTKWNYHICLQKVVCEPLE